MTRNLRWVALGAALLGLTFGPAPLPGAAADGFADFDVQPSVGQLAVRHGEPGAALTLRRNETEIDTGTVDAQGSYLWRNVEPGPGYSVEMRGDGSASATCCFTVLTPQDLPDPDFYAAQSLTEGFGYITTRDGTTLSATVHLPGPIEDGPYPTLVEYSGYDPSNPYSPQPSTLVAKLLGYAVVGINIRGTGCSGGSFFYFEELQSLDGYDAIETVAAQPWVANHAVGMVGISYPGISQLFTASTQPPHLSAIAPLSTIADTYRSTLGPGGIRNVGFARDWAIERQNDARPYGQAWTRRLVDEAGPGAAECAENQLLRLQNPDTTALIDANEFYIPELLDQLAPIRFVDRIDVPVFIAATWQDEQVGGQSAELASHFTSSPDVHVFLTNGLHVDPWLAQLQQWTEFLDFYVRRAIPNIDAFRVLSPLIFDAIGVNAVELAPDRFDDAPSFAAALAEYQADPDVRVLLENGYGETDNIGAPAGTKELGFSQWPPAETAPATWYFQPDGKLRTRLPSVAQGDSRATSSFVYDPTAKPETNFLGGNIWGPDPSYDWRPLPLGKALAFDSPALADDITAVGTGSVDLWLRSTAPDTDVEVTLTELRPDGQERYVQNGWLRASHRKLDRTMTTPIRPWHTHLAADAAPLRAGKLERARVELFPFAHVFRAGSRIRITVEAPGGNRAIWKFAARPANGVVVNEIAHSVNRASALVLPVIPNVDAPSALPPCPSLRGQPCRRSYGNAAPTGLRARTVGDHSARVRWRRPATVRDGQVIAGYVVRDVFTGRVRRTGPNAHGVTLRHVARGRHAFSVEALYNDDTTSGWSTPSRTVTVSG